jgi:hypothetical protein
MLAALFRIISSLNGGISSCLMFYLNIKLAGLTYLQSEQKL